MDRKLIYVLNHYSSKSVQHFYHILNLLIAMADKGVKIALIIEKCDDIPDIQHKNIEVICQKEKTKLKRGVELFRILTKLYKIGHKKVFVRITINSAIISIISAKIYGSETYYWQSGTTYEVDADKPFMKKIKWLVCSYSKIWFVKKNVNHFVTGPESMIDYYVDVLKVDREKMLLLYNDIDVKRFMLPTADEKRKIRERLGLDEFEKVVLMVHRLSPVRKTDKYIPYIFEDEKFSESNSTFIIIGDGPERKRLEHLIDNSFIKDRIKLLGSKPNSEVHEYYKAADVFINPSYTEGFPRVVIEAMASGLPVVTTNAGGTLDIFGVLQRDYVIDRNDTDRFRAALINLIGDERKLKELSEENLTTVMKYSTDAVSDMYIERIF